MTPEHNELLMRALGDELSPSQRQSFDRQLADDPALRQEWARLQKVQKLVADSRVDSFDPFFSTRVMAHIGQQQPSLADGLAQLFRPLVPVAAAAVLILSLFNWQDRSLLGDDVSLLEAAFAMPSASVETAELLGL